MSSVKVLWLTKGLGRGGAEMLLVALARAMDRSRLEIEVAYRLPAKTALVTTLEEAGVRVHSLSADGHWIGGLRRLLAEGDYDIVHTHAPLVGAAARLLAPRGTVVLHTEHNTWGRYHPLTRWANAATIGRNERVWAVSDEVARSIRVPLSWSSTPVEVMLHGVDLETTRHGEAARVAARARLGLGEGEFVFGTVGNLAPKKDQGSMLRAFARVQRALPQSRLVVIGTGPRERDLRGLADELGVGQAVSFLGMRDDVPDLLPGFDTFVLSSLHEGLSIALVEALAAGLPIVATRVGGIPELITHGEYGLLVPPHDPESLAAAMIGLARNDQARERLSAAGPVRAADFGIQSAADRLTAHYLVHGGRSATTLKEAS